MNTSETASTLRHYEPLVRHIARSLLSVARRTRVLDYEDLVAEGRIAVWESMSRYQGGMPERRFYALRIRHRLIDAIRRCSEHTRSEVRAGVAQSRVVVFEDETMAGPPSQETATLASQVLRAMDEMPERARRIVLMRDVEEWTGTEVGTEMGVSEARICQVRKESIARVQVALGEAA